MAVEVFPDSPRVGVVSPRISFDLSHYDIVPVEQYIRSTSSSTIDFDFCVFRESFDQDSSSADELFFDGKILPIEIKKRLAPPRTAAAAAPPLPPQGTQRPVEIKATNTDSTEEKQINQKSPSSSFWRFKRSSSLNCGSGYARTLCPLPLLSRSNSTGSTSSSKRSSLANNQKQNLLKYSSANSSQKQPPSSCHPKPPLKKTSHGSYCNGVKFNPVLNVPPATLFGLGTIFSGGKNGSKKK